MHRLVGYSSRASAAELAWNAPRGCSSDAFVLKVEEAAEQRLDTVAVAKIAIVVRQDAANGRQWQLELSFHDAANTQSPTRTLTGTSCDVPIVVQAAEEVSLGPFLERIAA